MTRILVIDNYDSFTYNLVHGLAAAGADIVVERNDATDRAAIQAKGFDGIVLSPGPGSPAIARDVGVCADLIRRPLDLPMLGVCLGMQSMAHYTGGTVSRAPQVVHGETSQVALGDHPLFEGLPGSVDVGRYHSLRVETPLPADWQALGSTQDGVLMAMAHQTLPWVGVQFHPESILSPQGPSMLANFTRMCR